MASRKEIIRRATYLLLTVGSATAASAEVPRALQGVGFDQRLDHQVPLDIKFTDEAGKPVQLRDYFDGKPVILVLGYYECPMLCTLVLNGLIEALQQMKWTAGSQFDVVCVSIDPRETPVLAAAKKRVCLRRYARQGSADGWHFLTGAQSSIQPLAQEVGFQYAWEPASRQFAHPSGLVILTPEGKVSGYLFGVTFQGQALHAALAEAAASKIGSPVQRLILLCFHYNPVKGKYGPLIMLTVRLLGAAVFLGLVGLILALSRKRAIQAEPPVLCHRS